MIELQPFLNEDFERLISWVNSEEELVQFAGPFFTFPLTNQQLQKYKERTDRRSFKVCYQATAETIGHCELNFQSEIPRLSRILIGNETFRGKGLGRQIVAAMLDILFKETNVEKVDLSVFDWNIAAIKCYEKIGFRINEGGVSQIVVNGKTWTSLNMILYKKEFSGQFSSPVILVPTI